LTRLSLRRAANEIYLYLLGRLEHHEACTQTRCHNKCDVAAFYQSLEAPLLPDDIDYRGRLEALAHGNIPA
jgi:hypothetical protein